MIRRYEAPAVTRNIIRAFNEDVRVPWQRPPRPPGLRPMSPASMGVVLLALVSGARSEATALVSWDLQEDDLNEALRLPVLAFADEVAAKRRGRKIRIDEYPSTQAAQRLGDAFVRRKVRGQAMYAWVPVEHRLEAMRIVADEIIVEKGVELRRAVNALEVMLTIYESKVGVLASADRSHSSPQERRDIIAMMAGLFRTAAQG